MNCFFLSSLPVLLLKIIPIVYVTCILQSTESLCSHLTPADKRFMTALKEVHSHTPLIYVTLQDETWGFLPFSTSLKSKTFFKARVIFFQVGVGTKGNSADLVPAVLATVCQKDMFGNLGADLKTEFSAQMIKLRFKLN